MSRTVSNVHQTCVLNTSRWFQQGTNPYTGSQDWLYTGGYFNRNYTALPNIYWSSDFLFPILLLFFFNRRPPQVALCPLPPVASSRLHGNLQFIIIIIVIIILIIIIIVIIIVIVLVFSNLSDAPCMKTEWSPWPPSSSVWLGCTGRKGRAFSPSLNDSLAASSFFFFSRLWQQNHTANPTRLPHPLPASWSRPLVALRPNAVFWLVTWPRCLRSLCVSLYRQPPTL